MQLSANARVQSLVPQTNNKNNDDGNKNNTI